MEPTLSFGIFADPHYSNHAYGDRWCADSLVKLRACIDVFNDRGLPLAFSLGDFIDHGDGAEKGQEVRFVAALDEVFASFRGERHHVIGNHDADAVHKAVFLAHCGGAGAGAHYSFDHGGVHFVVLDTNYHEGGVEFSPDERSSDWSDAWISRGQIDWLAEDLAVAGGRPAVVLCHGNLDYHEWEGRLDPHVVRDHAEVRAELERAGNVRAVVQGHYHHGRVAVQNGIPYITAAAMVVGPGAESNAYGIVSLGEDGSVTVDGFGRQQGWRVPPPAR